MKDRIKDFLLHSIGIIEIVTGASAFIGCTFYQIKEGMKPYNTYIFVIITAVFSLILGLGLLKKKRWARILLIFFSGYVVLTKLLIYSGVLIFKGVLITLLPVWIKDLISLVYHAFVIIFLSFSSCDV
ncbi:MAG: hypothetical protein U9R44_05350 [Candidatus Omnitrophota bacterium]|nr:hypothetical protein [Candidatus Omnitrophota bacterium]